MSYVKPAHRARIRSASSRAEIEDVLSEIASDTEFEAFESDLLSDKEALEALLAVGVHPMELKSIWESKVGAVQNIRRILSPEDAIN